VVASGEKSWVGQSRGGGGRCRLEYSGRPLGRGEGGDGGGGGVRECGGWKGAGGRFGGRGGGKHRVPRMQKHS